MTEISENLLRAVESAEPRLRALCDSESGVPILPGGWSRKEVSDI